MGMRVKLARGLLRFGAFIQSLPVVVMRPDDLVAFSQMSYMRPEDVDAWSEPGLVDSGLSADEQELLDAVPDKGGNLLLLGVGGGREALVFARLGFRVTGVDYIPDMVRRAQANAAQRGLCIDGLVQEISRLDAPASAYDMVWLSRSMYSCVPSRRRRVEMVRRIARALKPGGAFLCQFQLDPQPEPPGRGFKVRRLIAAASLGNRAYENGDTLWQNVEFLHEFQSTDEVREELEAGGLAVERILAGQNRARGGIVSRKSVETSGARPDGEDEK